jgi:hypothetical protein
MSLKIIFTKKYVTDESGTLAIQSIVNRKKTQKSMKIKMNQITSICIEELNGFKKTLTLIIMRLAVLKMS